MHEDKLAQHCSERNLAEIQKLLEETEDQIDLTYKNGLIFRLAVSNSDSDTLDLLLNYYQQTQLQTDVDNPNYKSALTNITSIIFDILRTNQVTSPIQKIIHTYIPQKALEHFEKTWTPYKKNAIIYRHILEKVNIVLQVAKDTPYYDDLQEILLPPNLFDLSSAYFSSIKFQDKLKSTNKNIKDILINHPEENNLILKALNYSIEGCLLDLQVFLKDSELDALNSAITSHKTELVREILTQNKELVYHTDIDEWGPIHFCAAKGNVETLNILLKNFEANVNQRTADFYTPALLAAQKGNIPCLIELARQSADLTARNLYGKDIISLLAENKPELKTIINDHPYVNFYLEQEDGHLKITGEDFISSDHIKYCIEVS